MHGCHPSWCHGAISPGAKAREMWFWVQTWAAGTGQPPPPHGTPASCRCNRLSSLPATALLRSCSMCGWNRRWWCMCGRRAASTSFSSRARPGEGRQRVARCPCTRQRSHTGSALSLAARSFERRQLLLHTLRQRAARTAAAASPTRGRLKGSELLQQLRLDERFVLYFHTKLTWHSPSASNPSNGSGSGSGAALAGRPPGQGSISAQADVQVWSEVVGPFQAIPRGILQARLHAGLAGLQACRVAHGWDAAGLRFDPGGRCCRRTAWLRWRTAWQAQGPCLHAAPRLPHAPCRRLQGTGNAVMGALMTALLPVFLRK